MPVTDEHKDMMKGEYADLCNIGKSKVCGASKAAAFLFHFIDEKVYIIINIFIDTFCSFRYCRSYGK